MAKIDFPKKQEQRLIPKYLLEYAEELQENHPDPSAEWGGGSGGDTIQAGTGIVITTESDDTKTISVDTEDVAMVNSLSSVAFSGSYSDLTNKPTNLVTTDGAEIITGTKTFEMPITVRYDSMSADQAQYKYDSINYTNLSYNITLQPNANSVGTMVIELPEDSGTIATTGDIPTNVSDFYNDAGYITGITSGDVTTALGYTPYDGSTNPNGYITSLDINNMVTTDTNQTITGAKTFTQWLSIDGMTSSDDIRIGNGGKLSIYDNNPTINYSLEMEANRLLYTANNNKSVSVEFDSSPSNDYQLSFPNKSGTLATKGDIPTAVSQLTNDSGFITGINSSDVTTALGYTPVNPSSLATVATTGAYSDLSNKPTIPDAVSGTNDGTNWTTLTIGSDTYGIGGGSSYTAGTGIDITGSTISVDNTVAMKTDIPTVPTTATSTVTPTTGTFVTGTTTTTTSLVFTYTDNTTETITLVTAVTDSTSSAMTGATVTTTLS